MSDPSQSQATGLSRWRRLLLIGMIMLWLPEILTRPLFGDDSYYLWSAKQMAGGVYPVRDFYCIDTVGILAYFQLLYVLGCHDSVSYWALTAVNVLVTAWLLGFETRRMTGSNSAGAWAGLIYSVFLFYCTPAYALVGKDMIAMPFLIGGLLLARSMRWWVLGHLIVGCGLAIKPTLGAVWLCWMAGDIVLDRNGMGMRLLKSLACGGLIGIPFLVATLWAEQHGWGWALFQVNRRLAGNYGQYFSATDAYKLVHVFAPVLWMVPATVFALGQILAIPKSQCLILMSLLIGGFVNWVIQPMFNTWYFVPFLSGIVILAATGMDRYLSGKRGQLAVFASIGLFFACVPSTNLRWIKLLTNIGGREKYTLVEHQSRQMEQYGTGNTPPYVQNWIRHEVAKLVPHGASVGITVTDGNLLWALRDYRPGFWAVWSPSWNPKELAEGLRAAHAEVVVGVEPQTRGSESAIYYDQVAQLQWPMPEEAVQALANNYQVVTNQFGYVIYRRREQPPPSP